VPSASGTAGDSCPAIRPRSCFSTSEADSWFWNSLAIFSRAAPPAARVTVGTTCLSQAPAAVAERRATAAAATAGQPPHRRHSPATPAGRPATAGEHDGLSEQVRFRSTTSKRHHRRPLRNRT
jgi:hypothetical protein